MNIFISGVMQGSIKGTGIQKQDYRQTIAEILQTKNSSVEIVDPIKMFPDSVSFDDEKAKETLFQLVDIASDADMIVAYLPEASMGSAMEMLRAYDKKKPIVTITPMNKNWFILSMSNMIFASYDEFETWVKTTNLEKWISEQN